MTDFLVWKKIQRCLFSDKLCMIITLLGVYIFIVDLMTMTFFQGPGVSEIYAANCGLWLTWKILIYIMISITPVGRPAGRLSLRGKNVNGGIFSNSINVKNVHFVHDGSTYWALAAYTTFSDLGCIARSPHWQTVLSENVMLLPD